MLNVFANQSLSVTSSTLEIPKGSSFTTISHENDDSLLKDIKLEIPKFSGDNVLS